MACSKALKAGTRGHGRCRAAAACRGASTSNACTGCAVTLRRAAPRRSAESRGAKATKHRCCRRWFAGRAATVLPASASAWGGLAWLKGNVATCRAAAAACPILLHGTPKPWEGYWFWPRPAACASCLLLCTALLSPRPAPGSKRTWGTAAVTSSG